MSTTTYEPIPADFKRSGFRFKLIMRYGMVALFERFKMAKGSDPEHPKHWEVVIISREEEKEWPREAKTSGTATVLAHERYPHSESWGTRGFTLTSKEAAEAKYMALLDEAAGLPAKREAAQYDHFEGVRQPDCSPEEEKRLEQRIKDIESRYRVLIGEEMP